MNSFYSVEELHEIGFKYFGNDVLVSKNANVYNPSKIVLGNHVRVDDFCILSGKIELGNYVHIAAYSCLFAGNTGINLKDFSGLSSRVVIYAESDEYSGEYLTNPTVPLEFRNIVNGLVQIGRHAIIGSGSSIMPGVRIGEGAAIGAMSLVNKDIEDWTVNVGIPAKQIKKRSRTLLKMEGTLMNKEIFIGAKAQKRYKVTSNDVDTFARLSGDYNPIHLDDEIASKSIFGRRVCHGMLVASYVSAVLGTQLPGKQCIYLGQELKFLKPVYINDIIEVLVEVLEIDQTKNRVKLGTNVINHDGEMVLTGQALVQVNLGEM